MSISRADLERIIQVVNSGDVESLKAEVFDQFQYQGFDPYKIVQTLLKIKKDKSISDTDFRTHIYTMVAIGMIKGSVNEHNITKMADEGQQGIKDLSQRYNVKMGGGRGQPSGVITYPRIMATFPDIAIRLVKVIGPKEFRGGPMLSTRLPSYMQVQVFPAIIPRDIGENAKRVLLTASLCYSIDQSVQISRLQNPDLKALAATQSNFVNVGHNSPVPSPEIRKNIFSGLSLSSDYDSIISVLHDYKSKVDDAFVIPTKAAFITDIVG